MLGRSNSANISTVDVRAVIWDQVSPDFEKHPLFGFGVGEYWGDGVLIYNLKSYWVVRQAHNGFIDLYLSFGGLGLGLFIGFIIAVARKMVAVKAVKIELIAMLAFLVFFLMINGYYSALFMQLSLPWFVTSVCFYYLVIEKRKVVR